MTTSPRVELPYPIHFVSREQHHWKDVLVGPASPDPEEHPDLLRDGRDVWTIQTYLHLKRRGHDVHLGEEYVPGCINVLHYDDLHLKRWPHRAFTVVVSPDRPRAMAADLRIVQNRLQLRSARDLYVVFWGQPGLLPREAARGTEVRRLGYLGFGLNLDRRFRSDEFRRGLAAMGIELVIREHSWTDCRDLDVLLAVRGLTDFDLALKPANKLMNAWRAGIPALLGVEPEYRFWRQSALDYFEVQDTEQALSALRRLQQEPALYLDMVENGRRRAEEFTAEQLCLRWEELLAGPVARGYERWKAGSRAMRVVRFAFRAVAHKYARYEFRRSI